jgi:hypothetical protein
LSTLSSELRAEGAGLYSLSRNIGSSDFDLHFAADLLRNAMHHETRINAMHHETRIRVLLEHPGPSGR